MLEQYSIPSRIREDARQVAAARVELWKKWSRNDYFESYSMLERNWQGCIAEVYMRELYPMLRLGQPFVVDGRTISECDYVYKDAGVELKCNRFKRMWNHFLKNVGEHDYKGYTAKVLICTAINAPPANASTFWIFGWINMDEIKKCEIWTSASGEKVKSDAYAIPRESLRPLSELFKPGDFNLSEFMRT